MKTARRRKRFERIVLAFVIATEGRVPVRMSLAGLLAAVNSAIPNVDESELRDALAWAIARSKRAALRFERRTFEHSRPRRRRPRLRLV